MGAGRRLEERPEEGRKREACPIRSYPLPTLARVYLLEQRRLARSILGDEAVAMAIGEFERLVLEELLAEERDRERLDLDVARILALRAFR